MVLQNDCLSITQRVGNVDTFLRVQGTATKPFVHGVTVVEATIACKYDNRAQRVLKLETGPHLPTSILIDHIDLLAERSKRLTRHRMTMNRRNDIRPGSMYCGVNCDTGRVDSMHVTTNNYTLVIHKAEVFRLHPTKALCMRVDPE